MEPFRATPTTVKRVMKNLNLPSLNIQKWIEELISNNPYKISNEGLYSYLYVLDLEVMYTTSKRTIVTIRRMELLR